VLLVGRWTDLLWFRRLQAAALAGLLLYLAGASLVLNVTRPMTFTNPVPALAEFLLSKGLTRGYSGFELAYPLAFQTGEALRLSPLAGPRVDDLYPPYTDAVESAPSPFYLYPEEEALAQALEDYLRRNGIGFETLSAHRHLIFARLARPVRPDEFLPEPHLTAYRLSRAAGGPHP
jgi:hypothetical protein